MWGADGTFDSEPDYFSQLYTIHPLRDDLHYQVFLHFFLTTAKKLTLNFLITLCYLIRASTRK